MEWLIDLRRRAKPAAGAGDTIGVVLPCHGGLAPLPVAPSGRKVQGLNSKVQIFRKVCVR